MQIQCRNCGGFKVSEEKRTVIATEKRQVDASSSSKMKMLQIGIAVFLLTTFGAFLQGNALYACIAGLFAILCVGAAWLLFRNGMKQDVPTIVRQEFYCNLCGYRWNWRNDEPYPHITVNPILIQQGEQRLEQKRREQEDWERRAQASVNWRDRKK
ncbi:MAG: hypothetical protein B6D41_06205 [Chloroflexi bacterium UTCFX4]|jgi:hypothetical protein|nr:MAG: hypothetical protein B6D41_06205 [Chloroflexi bacterium UTCFX4]